MIGIQKCPDCGEVMYNLYDYTYCDTCDVLRDESKIVLKTSLWKSKSAKHHFIYNVLLAKKGVIPVSELLTLIERPMNGDNAYLPSLARIMRDHKIADEDIKREKEKTFLENKKKTSDT